MQTVLFCAREGGDATAAAQISRIAWNLRRAGFAVVKHLKE